LNCPPISSAASNRVTSCAFRRERREGEDQPRADHRDPLAALRRAHHDLGFAAGARVDEA
jgi:hypothetical protein